MAVRNSAQPLSPEARRPGERAARQVVHRLRQGRLRKRLCRLFQLPGDDRQGIGKPRRRFLLDHFNTAIVATVAAPSRS
jgi:hypothetical protein